jgi:hypothetical protein
MKMLALAAAALFSAASAHAATYSTTLSGANETMPNTTTATGAGTLTLSTNMNFVGVNLSWAGLVAPASGAHLHCCAFQGANGPIAIDFAPPPVTTGGVSLFYDLTQAATYRPAFVTANGGTAAGARTAFLNGLTSGRAYYNVHNATFPGGQIRGQLALTAVPEPASWALMIGGFGLVGSALRQRRALTA